MHRVPRSKITPSQLPRQYVRRRELEAVLDRGEDCDLTLLCAPPGYGKTMLLASWVRAGPHVPTAWVHVDEDDNDPGRLWSAVLAALVARPEVPESSRLRRLVVSRATVELDFLSDLAECLDELPVRVRLILDDTHHLRSPAVQHGLDMLVRNRPSGVRLVVAGRHEPALPVARLRLQGRLAELRAEQLQFSVDEASVLLEHSGLRLSRRQTATLHERTDGWAAGLRLAALPLRGHPDPDRFLDAFSGDERPVADYLVDEVLSSLGEAEREVLRWVSVSDRVPPGLAVELSGRDDAAEVLDALAHRTGLVVTTPGAEGGYRTQELLRSYLVADLHRQGPDLGARLHGRAARWWSERDHPAEALVQAAQARDATLLIELVHRWAPELVGRGEHDALRRALAAVDRRPEGGTDPWPALVAAQVQLARGDPTAVRDALRRARRAGRLPAESDAATFRTATERLAGGGRVPTDDEPLPDAGPLAALARAGRGAAHVAAGAFAAGRIELDAALALARRDDLGLLQVQCLCLLGVAAWAEGNQQRAAEAASDAIAASAEHAADDSPWTLGAHAVLAHAALLRCEPATALRSATDGLRAAWAGLDPLVRFALRCAHGGALFDTGDRTGGLLELQQARAAIADIPVPSPLAAAAALLEHGAALQLGHRTAAAGAAAWLAARGIASLEVSLLHAWTHAAAGSITAARAAVAPVVAGGARPVLTVTAVEAWLIEARAALAAGDRRRARDALHEAVALAEPTDTVRPFAFVGGDVRGLLVDQLGGVDDPTVFAARALTARQRPSRPTGALLSARERDVLARLPSLHSLDEIASDLAVSINTVKSHVRAIYGKLGVTSRRDAVLTAHELGLLA